MNTTVEVEGRELRLTNLDKVLYPETGFTKADVIDYYVRVAPAILTHLAGRALTLVRFPNGADRPGFFEKRCPPHAPAWIRTVKGDPNHVLCDDLPTLIFLANLAALELHPSLALAGAPDRPTSVVFDLDPGPGTDVLDCAELALLLRDLLAAQGRSAVVKTSGSKGLQVYVPAAAAEDFASTKNYARLVAELLAREMPSRVVATMATGQRVGRVYIDWAQNDRHKTTVAAYSLRARARPTVSTPVSWSEVAEALAERDPSRLVFDAAAVIERLERHGDLFSD